MDDKTEMPGGKNTETEEEMEQETPEADKSSDDDTGSCSGSEDESSELDEEQIEKRRTECLRNMLDLEQQYTELKELLYKERLRQIEVKFEEVQLGIGKEYLTQLQELEEDKVTHMEAASVLKNLRFQSIDTLYECENEAALQNMESEKHLLFDAVKEDLQDKIKRLEEDRHNIDISSDIWSESLNQKKNKRRTTDPLNPNRRKKTITVTGPYIVYMLHEMDILEDWTVIKKALKQQSQKRKLMYY